MVTIITQSDPPEIEARLWQGWKGDIAFYVGANCGQHFAQLTETFRRIFAFEPSSDSVQVARRLAASIKSHDIDVFQMAISDHDGYVELANLIGTRQERTGQLVTLGHSGMEWDPGKTEWNNPEKVERVRVPCATLDSLSMSLGPPDFIMIDTEGHEWLIIQGAGRVISELRPGFLIEFHSPDNRDNIERVLRGHGYLVETVRSPHYPPRTLMWYQHGWLRARPLPRTGFVGQETPRTETEVSHDGSE